MPELPDLESFKKYFKQTSLNQKIVNIECEAKELIKKISFKNFKKKLIGKSFKNAWRRGKFLIIEVKKIPEKLILHFGMTGNLHYIRQGAPKTGQDRFSRLIFKFASGFELRWINIRKLGKVYLVKNLNEIKLLREMGPEPLTLSKSEFFKLLNGHSKKNIKAFLLDQRNIAGIGNIYSDEILFLAKISPHRKIESLSSKLKEKLYFSIQTILKLALERNLPRGLVPRSWILFNRKEEASCPRNRNHQLKREIIAGRSVLWCPKCQK